MIIIYRGHRNPPSPSASDIIVIVRRHRHLRDVTIIVSIIIIDPIIIGIVFIVSFIILVVSITIIITTTFSLPPGLGPCAEDEALLKETKSSSLPPLIPRLFAPPFILDSPKNRPAFVNDILGGGGAAGGGSGGAIDKSSATNGKANGSDKAATLFCGYCLSEDQRMLIAGEFLRN